jgi:hypothetical protein
VRYSNDRLIDVDRVTHELCHGEPMKQKVVAVQEPRS